METRFNEAVIYRYSNIDNFCRKLIWNQTPVWILIKSLDIREPDYQDLNNATCDTCSSLQLKVYSLLKVCFVLELAFISFLLTVPDFLYEVLFVLDFFSLCKHCRPNKLFVHIDPKCFNRKYINIILFDKNFVLKPVCTLDIISKRRLGKNFLLCTINSNVTIWYKRCIW